jgi:hypothetical protein
MRERDYYPAGYKGEILTNKGKIFLIDNNISERLKLLKNRKHKSKTEYV